MVSHTLRIKSIHWENIRNYEQLPNDNIGSDRMELNAKRHSLLQIQNNYGKTTTMHLLRSTFTGIPILPEHLEGYNYRQNTTEWGGNPGKIGTFKVFFELDDELFAIESVLDPVRKTHQFFTYRQMSGEVNSGGRRTKWDPPAFFKHLFKNKPDFVDLFILDGEKARELNRDASTDKIGTAIRQVTGLWDICDLIDEGSRKGRITGLVIDVLSKNIGKRGGKTDKLQKNLDECIKYKHYLDDQASKVKKELDRLISERDTINHKLEAFDKEKMQQSQELTDAKDAEKIAKNHLAEASQELMNDLFNPANIVDPLLWNEVVSFYNSQIQGKMPKGMTKNWFSEIVNNHDNCICGTPWNEEMIQYIDEHKEQYLDDVLMPRVKSLQATIVGSKAEFTLTELKKRLDAHREAVSEAGKAVRAIRDDFPEDEKTEYDNLVREQGGLDVKIASLRLEYEFIKSTNRDFILKHDLNRYTLNAQGVPYIEPNRFGEIPNIFELEKVEKYIVSKMLESSESAKKAKGAEILQEILTGSIEQVLHEISAALEVKMNNVAKKMPGLNAKVRISDSGLEFRNPAGELQESLNESAELGAIYGLVASLNTYSDVSLPIVVDTPLAGFGRGMAHAWQKVVISTFDQTVSLINSSEKFDLEFWWGSQPDNVQYFTFLRENENPLTGKDYDWNEDNEQETTGPMYVNAEFEIFAEYEKDVGRNLDGGV